MSNTKVHGAVVVENGLLDVVRNEIGELPGGKIVKEYYSTIEEVKETDHNGYVLAKYHQEFGPIYTTVIFEYILPDPQDFVNNMFAPVRYLVAE